MHFIGKICDIFHHQYLDILKFVFISKACRIMFCERTAIFILDMRYALYVCNANWEDL